LKSFPKPLTAAEEAYYMQKYTEGDLKAKHILIERNLRLVAHIVKKYPSREEDVEDLLSIGTIGLIKAVVSFDPEKRVRLGTYAARCIENEILMHLRAKKKMSREISLYEPIGTDREGNEIQLFDVIETKEEDAHRHAELKESVRILYAKNGVGIISERTAGSENAIRTLWGRGVYAEGDCRTAWNFSFLCITD
jgi:spore_sigmaK: RNA polymerase sigma-K factor